MDWHWQQVTSSSSAVQPTTVRYLQPIVSLGQQRPAAPVISTSVSVHPGAGIPPVRAVPVPAATSTTSASSAVVKVSTAVRPPAPATVQTSVTSTQSTTPTQTELQNVEADASNPVRGIKRPASKAMISKSTLFEHQLKTDQNGAVAPDCK